MITISRDAVQPEEEDRQGERGSDKGNDRRSRGRTRGEIVSVRVCVCVCVKEGPAVPCQQFQGAVSGETCRWQVDLP